MSESFDARRKARVLELLARADDPARALEGTELASDPGAHRLLRDLVDLESRLSAAGKAARDEIAAAENLADPAAGSASTTHPDAAGPATAAPRPRRWRVLLPLAAAAAVVLMWYSWRDRGGEKPPTYLGGAAVLAPRGASPSFEFRWDVERPPSGYFVIRVSELEPGPDGRKLVHESSPIREQAWTPEPDITSQWPRRIHWELLVYDGSSPRPAATYSADAWLE